MHTIASSHHPLLRATSLSFSRENVTILSGVTFAIYPGEYVGIIGPNGGGKTTLLHLLLGLERPTSGGVTWEKDILARGKVGYVPQYAASFDPFFPATVREIVASGGAHARLSAGDARVSAALRRCGIEHLQHRRIGEVSGGERQRAFVARALVNDPEVLALDEPMSAVDALHRESFYDVLRDIHKQGVTVLMVSHDVHALEHEASRVLCIHKTLVSYEDLSQELHGHHH